MEPASTQHSGAVHTIQMWHNHSEVMFFCPTTGLLQERPLIKKRLRIAEEKEKTMKKNRKDDRERYRLRNIWTVYCENIPTWDKVTKRINLICAPLACVTAWLSSLLFRVQSWTPSSSQSKGEKYSEIIKTWSSRRKYRILDFLWTWVSLGKEQTFTEASITPYVGTHLNAKYFLSSLLPRRELSLILHSEANMEFPCGFGPHCMSFFLQTSLSESFLLKSIFIYPFSVCHPSMLHIFLWSEEPKNCVCHQPH